MKIQGKAGRSVMRQQRHAAILRLIADQDVETQADLLHLLQADGFDITQATVSRDIAQLGLIKTRGPAGRGRYSAPAHGAVGDVLERTKRALRDYVVDMHSVGPLILLKTLAGRANALAAALDELDMTGVLGTIAGDDAVLVVVQSEVHRPPAPEVAAVMRTLDELRG